jgi:hypothetical protein
VRGEPSVVDKVSEISAGNVFIKNEIRVPDCLNFEGQEYSSWKKLLGVSSGTIELIALRAGWSFSYVAPAVVSQGWGFQRQSALDAAIRRMMSAVLRLGFNSLEIKRIGVHYILPFHHVSLVATPHQLRPNPFLRDPDPYYYSQSI